MKRTIVLLAAIAFCAVGTAFADYSFRDEGTWPKTWPKELEPLRKISRTLIGNKQLLRHYAIPFTDRDEFESAWPHILKVKSKGTSLRLMRGPDFFLSGGTAGVVLHCPPENKSDAPVTLDLVVDGAIVDLNRIPLPPDTPINDERFKDAKNK